MKPPRERPVWFVLTQHWLSLFGAGLVITAALSWLFVLPQHVRGHVDNPYLGIILFLILPAVFFVGLALIPIGVYLSKRQIRRGLAEAPVNSQTVTRRLLWFFGITTFVNILIGTQVTYRAVKYMETPQFCGATCHAMKPEFSAYLNASHSHVECSECHVAPTGTGWIKAKASGVRQLVETVSNSWSRPIPPALASNRLVPASQTCENCHWTQKLADVRLRVISRYAEDEANSRTQTVLVMMIGAGRSLGIHGAHVGPGIHVRFAASDAGRQDIPWVEYRNDLTGKTETYVASGSASTVSANLPKYEMQCVDCHNRPSHTFEMPDRALDRAMASGEIPVTLPFIKKKGLEVLKATYASAAEAADKAPNTLIAYYKQNYPKLYSERSQEINEAAQAVLAAYNRNVFPDLKVTWGTYPNNLGHTDFPGCFRCHDSAHEARDGKAISQDCQSCHETVASDEASPEILKTLGIAERISNLQKQ